MKTWMNFLNLWKNGGRIELLEIKRLMTFLKVHHVSFYPAYLMGNRKSRQTL